jgi:hypothetical protein
VAATRFRDRAALMEGEQMRYLAIGVCVLAAACGSSAPTAPETVPNPGATGLGVTAARAGADLPFRGRLDATEDASSVVHHLIGAGNGTHLGHFTYAADITIDEATGDGAGEVTYTAANGDQILAKTAGSIVNLEYPILVLREQQTLTGGTGRFVGASGTVVMERTLNLETGATTGSFDGTLHLSH